MLTPNHLITAQTAYLGACVAAAHHPAAAEAFVAFGVALVPDFDSRQPYPGRVLPPLSDWLEQCFGHRTLTRSPFTQALAGLVAWWMLTLGFLLLLAGWAFPPPAGVAMTPGLLRTFRPARARRQSLNRCSGEIRRLSIPRPPP